MTTLPLTNAHSSAVVLSAFGLPDVTIPSGDTEEVGSAYLFGEAFQDAFMAGQVTLPATAGLTADQILLGRLVVENLVSARTAALSNLHNRMKGVQTSLAAARADYNPLYDATQTLNTEGDTAKDPATRLFDTSKAWLDASVEQAQLTTLTNELAALEATDPNTIGDLPAFIAQVDAKQAEIVVAQAALAQRQTVYAQRFGTVVNRLEIIKDDFVAASAFDLGDRPN